jgi:hypothetical protein
MSEIQKSKRAVSNSDLQQTLLAKISTAKSKDDVDSIVAELKSLTDMVTNERQLISERE